jgi:hypothetical protein
VRKEGEIWRAMLSEMHLAREVAARAARETGELQHELKQHMRRCSSRSIRIAPFAFAIRRLRNYLLELTQQIEGDIPAISTISLIDQ